MSNSEILALSSPKARGILVPPPPINLSIALQPGDVVLNWTGGDGLYQVQKNTSLTGVWQDIGGPTHATSAIVPREITGGFFRVVGQF